jgi:hypothetical protein
VVEEEEEEEEEEEDEEDEYSMLARCVQCARAQCASAMSRKVQCVPADDSRQKLCQGDGRPCILGSRWA